MKCPTCGNELRNSTKDPNYALCDTCHKKYKLPSSTKATVQKAPPQKADSAAVQKKTPEAKKPTSDSQQYSNIPPEHIRNKKEQEMRQNYDALLAAGKEETPKKTAKPKRPAQPARNSAKSAPPRKSSKSKSSSAPKRKRKSAPFKTGRLVIGILSILLFLFITFQSCAAGLGNMLSNNGTSSGTAGLLLAVCFLIAGITSIVFRNKQSGIGFFVPAIFYIIGGYIAAANVGTYADLKIWAILSTLIGAAYLLLLFLYAEMNKIVSVAIPVVILAIAIALCIIGGKTDSKNDSKKKDSNKKTVADKKAKKDDGVIDFTTDTFTIKYTKHELSTDSDGKECLLVYYDFTNNDPATLTAASSASLTASQNDTQCVGAVIDTANESINNYLKEVPSGETVNVCQAFALTDKSDVTLDVTELVSIDGKNDTQVIKL